MVIMRYISFTYYFFRSFIFSFSFFVLGRVTFEGHAPNRANQKDGRNFVLMKSGYMFLPYIILFFHFPFLLFFPFPSQIPVPFCHFLNCTHFLTHSNIEIFFLSYVPFLSFLPFYPSSYLNVISDLFLFISLSPFLPFSVFLPFSFPLSHYL